MKLWTLFSGEEDFELARAASGGLAQLTHDLRICAKVMQAKSATTILKELLANEKDTEGNIWGGGGGSRENH